jgi:hypothetical protein
MKSILNHELAGRNESELAVLFHIVSRHLALTAPCSAGAPERSRLSRKYQTRPFGGDDGPGLMPGLFRHRRHTVVFETS